VSHRPSGRRAERVGHGGVHGGEQWGDKDGARPFLLRELEGGRGRLPLARGARIPPILGLPDHWSQRPQRDGSARGDSRAVSAVQRDRHGQSYPPRYRPARGGALVGRTRPLMAPEDEHRSLPRRRPRGRARGSRVAVPWHPYQERGVDARLQLGHRSARPTPLVYPRAGPDCTPDAADPSLVAGTAD